MLHVNRNYVNSVFFFISFQRMKRAEATKMKQEKRTMECPFTGCGAVVLQRNFARHARDKHLKCWIRAKCPSCTSTFKTMNWARDHLRKIHKYDKETTDKKMIEIRREHSVSMIRGVFDRDSSEEEEEQKKEEEIRRIVRARRKTLRLSPPPQVGTGEGQQNPTIEEAEGHQQIEEQGEEGNEINNNSG